MVIGHGKVRDDVEKKMNEKHQQIKNNNTNKMKINNITKTSRGSPKQVPSLGVFDYFMVIVIIL